MLGCDIGLVGCVMGIDFDVVVECLDSIIMKKLIFLFVGIVELCKNYEVLFCIIIFVLFY